MDGFLTEAEIIRILKGGKRMEREMEERAEYLSEEKDRQVRDRKTWKKLGLGSLLVMEERAGESDELDRLLRDMEACRVVRRGLWSIDPLYRRLLCCYYTDRMEVSFIAEELGISESTFWRWRRRAVADLVSACQKVPNEIQWRQGSVTSSLATNR